MAKVEQGLRPALALVFYHLNWIECSEHFIWTLIAVYSQLNRIKFKKLFNDFWKCEKVS